MIYNAYLKSGTVGNCGSTFCHPEASTPTGAYSYLESKNYMSGSPLRLVRQGQSCLSWYGGDMPIGRAGSDNTQAVMDTNVWAAAGANND